MGENAPELARRTSARPAADDCLTIVGRVVARAQRERILRQRMDELRRSVDLEPVASPGAHSQTAKVLRRPAQERSPAAPGLQVLPAVVRGPAGAPTSPPLGVSGRVTRSGSGRGETNSAPLVGVLASGMADAQLAPPEARPAEARMRPMLFGLVLGGVAGASLVGVAATGFGVSALYTRDAPTGAALDTAPTQSGGPAAPIAEPVVAQGTLPSPEPQATAFVPLDPLPALPDRRAGSSAETTRSAGLPPPADAAPRLAARPIATDTPSVAAVPVLDTVPGTAPPSAPLAVAPRESLPELRQTAADVPALLAPASLVPPHASPALPATLDLTVPDARRLLAAPAPDMAPATAPSPVPSAADFAALELPGLPESAAPVGLLAAEQPVWPATDIGLAVPAIPAPPAPVRPESADPALAGPAPAEVEDERTALTYPGERVDPQMLVLASAPADQLALIGAQVSRVAVYAPERLDADRRDWAAARLSKTGWQTVETTTPYTIRETHVRYYHPQDRAAAEQLAMLLETTARDFTSFRPSPDAGYLEVWLGGRGAPQAAPVATRAASTPSYQVTRSNRGGGVQATSRAGGSAQHQQLADVGNVSGAGRSGEAGHGPGAGGNNSGGGAPGGGSGGSGGGVGSGGAGGGGASSGGGAPGGSSGGSAGGTGGGGAVGGGSGGSSGGAGSGGAGGSGSSGGSGGC
jgi:hypothetical protein